MGFRKKLMSSESIKGQGFNGFRRVTGTLNTSTTKHPNSILPLQSIPTKSSLKGQGSNGFKRVTGTLNTSTTKHPNEKRKMRLEGYGIKMKALKDAARIWWALQA